VASFRQNGPACAFDPKHQQWLRDQAIANHAAINGQIAQLRKLLNSHET
jgi:hypothetical protein